MRNVVLNIAALAIGLIVATTLLLGGLFAYDRMLAATTKVDIVSSAKVTPDLYSMDIYPYTGFHMLSHFSNGNLKSGDNGFFIDFPLKHPPEKAHDEFRIILIGGSAAMGVYLSSNDKTLAKVLEDLLNKRRASR